MSNLAQTITFNSLNAVTYSLGGTVSLTGNAAATASSSLSVSYVSSDESVATILGTTVSILKAGFTDITASQAGDGTYAPATDVVQRLTINKISQTITFAALTAVTYSQGGTKALTGNAAATASSTLSVSYASSDESVATISGTTINFLKGGVTNITASQAGNDFYAPATDVVQIFTINKISQTITFAALAAVTYSQGGTKALTGNAAATATSSLSVSYASSDESVATISGTTINFLKGGVTNITASQAGNDFYAPATDVVQIFTIKISQTITFNPLAVITYSNNKKTLNLQGTASSTLDVSYASSDPNIATIDGNTLTIVKAGKINITASQTGNATYDPATEVVQELEILKGTPTFNAWATINKTYRNSNFTVTAPNSPADYTSDGTITYANQDINNSFATITSGGLVSIVGAGNVTIRATQAATNLWESAYVETTLQIAKATQTITFAAISNLNYRLNYNYTTTPSSNSNLLVVLESSDSNIVTVDGFILNILNVSSSPISITATQTGDANFEPAAQVVHTFSVLKGTPTFNAWPNINKIYGDANFTVTATSPTDYTSNGAITYSKEDNNSFATITSGGLVSIVSAGDVTTIRATQAATSKWNSASVETTLIIAKADQTITFDAISNLYYRLNYNYSPTRAPFSSSGLTVELSSSNQNVITVSGLTLNILNVSSSISITASQIGNTNYKSATPVVHTFSVLKGTPTFNATAIINKTYGNSNFTITVPSSPTDYTSDGAITYANQDINNSFATITSGGLVSIVGAGNVTIRATQVETTKWNSAFVDTTIQIAKATQTITFDAIPNLYYRLNYNYIPTAQSPPTRAAFSSSGLSVALRSSNESVVTVSGLSLNILDISSSPINITASQTGNDNYEPATEVVNTFSVLKGTPTFNWPIINKTYGDANFTVTAPTSPANYTSDGTITYANQDINNSLATINDAGGFVTIVGAGDVTIRATQAATTKWNSAYVETTLKIAKAYQTITFAALENKTYSPNNVIVNLSAEVTTGNTVSPITFISSDLNVGTIVGTVLTLKAAGPTDITARAAGNDNYFQTDLVRRQTVNKATQTITFNALSNITYAPSLTFNLTATASSNLPVSYSTNNAVLNITGSSALVNTAGTVRIYADQNGNTNYFLATPISQDLVIDKANQTISFNALTSLPYSALSTSTLSATATSTLPVIFESNNSSVASVSSTTLTIQGVGTATITASQAGNINYNPTSIQRDQTITKVADPVCFNEGTFILCLNKNFQEEYILINDLRRGDMVKTYKHGYRKIEMVGKCPMVNDPNRHSCCMYKMIRNDHNGLIEDLTVTGGHAILVNNIDPFKEENERLMGATQKIDDKYLLLAAASPDFVKLENNDEYTYYHFILENNGNDDERFGIWSNGILSETPSKRQFLQNNNLIIF